MRRYRDTSATRRGDAGFALLAAIGLAAAVALTATAALREGRTAARVAGGATAAAQARAAAEAGIWRAADEMAATGAVASAPWLFEGHAVRVAASVERGKVDLNLAPPDRLALAAELAGDQDPSRFAEAALAARRAHAAAGVSWRLAARPFHGVDEARALVSESVWPRLAPLLTVHGAAAPDPALAPGPLRAALGEAGAREADLVPGDVIALRAAAVAPDGARAALEALIRLEEGGGLAALAWRDARP
jgi:hypothetical protein